MPHLIAYKDGNNRHLVRWNNSPTFAARHLGAGYVDVTLTMDRWRSYVWGQYWHEGIVDKAKGFTSTQTRQGEIAVADALRIAVMSNSSTWPYQGNDWAESNVSLPYWYHQGFCVSGFGSPDRYTESAMCVCARHFTLPEEYRNAGLSVVSAKVKWNGLASYVQNIIRTTSSPMFYPTHDWDSNNSIWGSSYTLKAESYLDSQSIAVHLIPGFTIDKTIFPPSSCFCVYDNTPLHNAYELRQLVGSFYLRNGYAPTKADLLRCFSVDFNDPLNAHWKVWGYLGSRSNRPNPLDRFSAHVWARQHGGYDAYQDLYTAGSGWRIPVLRGASDYPSDRDYLLCDMSLSDNEKDALLDFDGMWVVMHGLPILSHKSLYGGPYLPTGEVDFEYGPWLGAANQSAVGRYIGTQVESLNDFKLEVILG